ncbi:diguanylate cyclase [Lysinibacillus sp. OL1_EC]|uniref:sensor domain-containing diguanylate cyclase n=1 Tax=unclassified Lysinibacillus TaxID=2636778 RepID=UPI0010398BA0|nr:MULTISPECIES: sensor domain-containing diguanylate cyclase [unclassified Lysinibacillus]MCM0626891.1 diguanylate cyclase [Lysinibacillus sp. OL1_EC]TBV85579.1 sensor domain-containing diguanylate cyclase [Lysinibacillus sp. OL1]UKJ45656.1 diguanylate cyclase [Lysinibacillus sp. ACHW1.5]
MKSHRLKLKHLIMGVAMAAFFLTSIGSVWGGYRMNIDSIKENALETNRVYAQKLASTADSYLHEAFQILGYSAEQVRTKMDDEQVLNQETERLRLQNQMFNSVVITNAKGLVLSVSPPSIEIKGEILTSIGAKEALAKKTPIISKPYEAMTGRLIIFISHPIFSESHEYLGMIAGTIYLKEPNAFKTLLGEHYSKDGSYVYVVDSEGRVIYHQDPSRINDIVTKNKVVQAVTSGKDGAQLVENTKGVKMLAGYSAVASTGWGVVAQKPLEVALAPSFDRVQEVIIKSVPLMFVSIIIVLWAAARIANPLQQLASLTEESLDKKNVEGLKSVSGWYFEAYSLKNALVRSLSFLHGQVSFFKDQSTVDPLTGITNRRTMDSMLAEWLASKVPHVIILLDLDHFKSVNDTYGHAVGDKVLQFLAKKMESVAREGDVCCRYGGEEFVMLLPNTTVEEATLVAEQLRKTLADTVSPCGRPITLSAGIAAYPAMASTTEALIEAADDALYLAKQEGRNQVKVGVSKKE